MPCEHYKDALIESAASGTALQGELRAHLAECASCREAFAEEQLLFASIDSSLHASANAEVPLSLLPRVRVALDQAASPRLRWLQPLVFASAGVALALAIFLIARPRHASPEDVARQGTIAPAITTPMRTTNPEKIASEDIQIATVHAAHSDAPRNSTNLHSAASGNPEVLVPPDEREAFARLVAVLNEHGNVVSGLLGKVPQKDAPETGDPPKIPDIEIKPLDGSGSDASDGAGEKQ